MTGPTAATFHENINVPLRGVEIRDCEDIGIDGLMVLPAMVYKSDPRETLTHYRSVADG